MEPTNNSFTQYVEKLFQDSNLQTKEGEFNNLKDQPVDLVYSSIRNIKTFKDTMNDPKDIKSNTESEQLRLQGNYQYIRYKNYLDALECYTKSIAFAENGSSNLALAYGNRSAVLFEKKYYKECIKDIDRALLSNCSENLNQKLQFRKVKAENLKSEQKLLKYYNGPPNIKSKNPVIPCAADSVTIQYNGKYGRQVIATRDIKIGEVVSAENSYCHVVHTESKYTNCHQCLNLCYNMIPCENCTAAFYCSEECKSKCYDEYHKYECHFPKVLLFPEKIFIKLTLRGMEYSKQLKVKESEEMYRSDSFNEIQKLETNETKRGFFNRCMIAISASMAYHVLKKNKEFTTKYNSDEDDDNLKKMLYRNYMIIASNAFDLGKTHYTLLEMETKSVGEALYAFSSLYNHSCVSNCENSFCGSSIYTRTKAHIKKGEQLFISYGMAYYRIPKPIRQLILLKHHMFRCDCKACTKNWPINDDLPLGKELPLSFETKVFKNTMSGVNSNKRSMEEVLSEAKNLYYIMEKQQPCQNLLRLQQIIMEIYTYSDNKDEF